MLSVVRGIVVEGRFENYFELAYCPSTLPHKKRAAPFRTVQTDKENGEGFKPSPFGVAYFFEVNVVFYSSDQFHKVFGGSPHLKEDHTELPILARHRGQNGFITNSGQNNGTFIPFNINLFQPAAPKFT